MAIRYTAHRTNVRMLLVAAGLVICSACVTSPSLLAARQPCDPGGLSLCERFGAERQCRCAAANEARSFMSTFGEPAWPGASR
jgi:hypothetical protein